MWCFIQASLPFGNLMSSIYKSLVIASENVHELSKFYVFALDGELFDIYEINGGDFVDIENIRDNAYRFFVNTNA